MELSEFDISYQPQAAIKAQALVDFIAEYTESGKKTNNDQTIDQTIGKESSNGVWLVIVDRS